MLKNALSFLVAALIVFSLFGFAENAFSGGFRDCVTNDAAAAQKLEDGDRVADIVARPLVCSIHFADQHDGLFGVIGGFVASFFAYMLIRSSDFRWKAGTRQQAIANRAFVFIKTLDAHAIRDAQSNVGGYRLIPLWTNGGNTPTKGLIVRTNWTSRAGDLPDGYRYDYAKRGTVMVLGPHVEAGSDIIEIGANEMSAAMDGAETIFVWGRADYLDIFPKTKPHHTRFCYRLVASRTPNDGADIGFAHYGAYNDAD